MEAPFIYPIHTNTNNAGLLAGDCQEGDCACADIPPVELARPGVTAAPQATYCLPKALFLNQLREDVYLAFHPVLPAGPFLMNGSAYQMLTYFQEPHRVAEASEHFHQRLGGVDPHPFLRHLIEAGLITAQPGE